MEWWCVARDKPKNSYVGTCRTYEDQISADGQWAIHRARTWTTDPGHEQCGIRNPIGLVIPTLDNRLISQTINKAKE